MFGITGDEINPEVNPSKLVKPSHFSPNVNLFLLSRFIQADPSVDELAEEEIDVEGSKNRVGSSREGKFLVYWMTTTSISTITSYSSTMTGFMVQVYNTETGLQYSRISDYVP